MNQARSSSVVSLSIRKQYNRINGIVIRNNSFRRFNDTRSGSLYRCNRTSTEIDSKYRLFNVENRKE